ncbi:HD domain-containing protein [Kaarinaea lacus]
MSELIERAKQFATRAHQRIDHRRKYNNQPYHVHLEAVAKLVTTVTDDEEMVAAAWLHDVVEDTPATLEDLEKAFGPSVTQLVKELTDISRPSDGNRAERKAIDRQHIAQASAKAKTVKLADLIDNCKDITHHDQRFAQVYLSEMSALLDVLGGGDSRLFKQAHEVYEKSLKKLGPRDKKLDSHLPPRHIGPLFSQMVNPHFRRAFTELFTAKDLAQPLLSFDADKECHDAYAALSSHQREVASIRIQGAVQGYILKADTTKIMSCAEVIKHFAADQIVDGNDPITDVIHVLTRHSYCFVSLLGDVGGVIDRNAINNPIARMWLFGIVTIVELRLAQLIEDIFPDNTWHTLISEGRLTKAKEVQAERQRRNLHCDLLECLQLSDKAQILMNHQPTVDAMGFNSKKVAKQIVKDLESLRNHLAHAQDIVRNDWAQIARLALRIDELSQNPAGSETPSQ